MCGILTAPTPDAARGARLTLERTLEHVGGAGGLVSSRGRELIRENIPQYIWKYPDGRAHCTACGARVDGIRFRHGQEMNCPACGAAVRARHEARGHARLFDQFILYEWRRSETDREAVTLTAAHVWRDSTGCAPECEPVRVAPCAIYLFRPGKSVCVYKGSAWAYEGRNGAAFDASGWGRVESVNPEHRKYGTWSEYVMDLGVFREALRGTRIGRLYDLLGGAPREGNALELTAIANCARRPWLEYLFKSGQERLAKRLMRMERISREIVPNPRARTPRELLGLTEAQWFEARRDGVQLDPDDLYGLTMLRRMGLEKMKLGEALAVIRNPRLTGWVKEQIAPHRPGEKIWRRSVGDMLNASKAPDKLRRKIYRRILAEADWAGDWRDYYEALSELGEDMTDAALMLPRDMPAMHDRMTERLALLRAGREAARKAELEKSFAPRLKALKRDYTFSACGLTLRPYETVKEIIEEGVKLKICIGSYADRYMRGDDVICCLRKADEPDTPWRAVEFSARNGMLVQDRGYRNDMQNGIDPETKELLARFWAAFKNWRAGRRRKTA